GRWGIPFFSRQRDVVLKRRKRPFRASGAERFASA
ncbi:hypothetical protein ACVWZI_002790, partial [Thermostichus sp. OS-CIW-28]